MTKKDAFHQLNIGYIIASLGFILGLMATKEMKLNFMLSGLLMAYAFWGTYWGFRIVQSPINKFFSGGFIIEKSITKLIWRRILYKFTILAITFVIAYFVGLLGGAIYKQITLMHYK